MHLPRISCAFCCVCVALLLLPRRTAPAGELRLVESVEIKGKIAKSKDISALGVAGEFLVIASDETNRCQILNRKGGGFSLLPENDVEFNASGEEIDIEGIACDGNRVYAIGSHSLVRTKLAEDDAFEENRSRIAEVKVHPARDLLAGFTLNENGRAKSIRKTSLRSVIEGNAILRRFALIPSKENGIDLEGIAVKEERLYLGFRGPVLRGNFVPVLVCEFDRVESGELLFVDLGGFGIRDMASVQGGFLILGGPVGDAVAPHKVFFWNGRDCLPGIGGPERRGAISQLCEIPAEADAKAEGMAITAENDSSYEFLMAFDGVKDGGIKRFRLSKN